MRPEDLILRCYARRLEKDRWYAVCLEFNLDAEGDSLQAVRRSLDQAIIGYLETVATRRGEGSIAHLLKRSAPLKDWVIYYAIRLVVAIRRLRSVATFQEAIPFQLVLAHNCA